MQDLLYSRTLPASAVSDRFGCLVFTSTTKLQGLDSLPNFLIIYFLHMVTFKDQKLISIIFKELFGDRM